MIVSKNLRIAAIAMVVLSCVIARRVAAAEMTEVAFDIPDKIECRDVTPEKCAAAHPNLKVVEAKFRISASFIRGSEANAVDFDYVICSPGMRLKILDYLPNTTLESTYADDRIEVADMTENTDSTAAEARVAYSVLSLSSTKNQSAKKTEQNHYKRVAPKSLVLASGTTNRGHGVFFKLRPSNGASLEGAKEFTFLAIVPKEWRGDWCTFVCAARANKKSLVSSSIVLAGRRAGTRRFVLVWRPRSQRPVRPIMPTAGSQRRRAGQGNGQRSGPHGRSRCMRPRFRTTTSCIVTGCCIASSRSVPIPSRPTSNWNKPRRPSWTCRSN